MNIQQTRHLYVECISNGVRYALKETGIRDFPIILVIWFHRDSILEAMDTVSEEVRDE